MKPLPEGRAIERSGLESLKDECGNGLEVYIICAGHIPGLKPYLTKILRGICRQNPLVRGPSARQQNRETFEITIENNDETRRLYREMERQYNLYPDTMPEGWTGIDLRYIDLKARVVEATIEKENRYGEVLKVIFLLSKLAPDMRITRRNVETLVHTLTASMGVWYRDFLERTKTCPRGLAYNIIEAMRTKSAALKYNARLRNSQMKSEEDNFIKKLHSVHMRHFVRQFDSWVERKMRNHNGTYDDLWKFKNLESYLEFCKYYDVEFPIAKRPEDKGDDGDPYGPKDRYGKRIGHNGKLGLRPNARSDGSHPFTGDYRNFTRMMDLTWKEHQEVLEFIGLKLGSELVSTIRDSGFGCGGGALVSTEFGNCRVGGSVFISTAELELPAAPPPSIVAVNTLGAGTVSFSGSSSDSGYARSMYIWSGLGNICAIFLAVVRVECKLAHVIFTTFNDRIDIGP